jgi:hypothetical protein
MKKSELKNYIRENIISTLSENIEDETKALDDYESKLDDVIKKKQEAGIEEDATPKGEDFFYDYLDIGMSYLEGFGKNHSLDDTQLEKLGKKIVDQLYKGDVGKAYDAIVKRGAMNEDEGGNFAELKKYQKMLDDAAGFFRKKADEYGVDVKTFGAFNQGINDLVDFVFKANNKRSGGKIDENEDKEPSKADLKKTKGLAKAKEELALLTREMKSLAKKYSKAEGEEKEKLVADLKKKTKLKKELEAIIDK